VTRGAAKPGRSVVIRTAAPLSAPRTKLAGPGRCRPAQRSGAARQYRVFYRTAAHVQVSPCATPLARWKSTNWS